MINDRGLAGVILLASCHYRENARHIAWTDGAGMFFGPRFFELNEKQQLYVIVHEDLHVILRHVQRGLKMEKLMGRAFSWDCWNVACDCLVNWSLDNISWMQRPENLIDIRKEVAKEDLDARSPGQWTVEQLYHYLRPKWQEIQVRLQEGNGQGGCRGGFERDLDPDGASPDRGRGEHEVEVDGRIMTEKLRRAFFSSEPGGVLRKLSGDIPAPRVPWEKTMRAFVRQRVSPRTEENWSRPSRSTLSVMAAAGQVIYNPGIQAKKGIRRVAGIVDTSGSIDDNILLTFTAELNGIGRQLGCEIVLIVADASVQQVELFRSGRIPASFTYKGGGGTDFRPGIEELAKHNVACAVYLTDLCGTFPDKAPKVPLLWAATTDLKPPFGKVVRIPDSLRRAA